MWQSSSKRGGYTICVAYTPELALELAGSFEPDVTLLDVWLGVGSGYEKLCGCTRRSDVAVSWHSLPNPKRAPPKRSRRLPIVT